MSRSVPGTALIAVAVVVALAAVGTLPRPAAALTRTPIAVDGGFADWHVVLRDARNLSVDRLAIAGDPDAPPSPDRDLRAFAVTWDPNNLALYFRRGSRGPNPAELLAYIDLDGDDRLGAADRVARFRIDGSGLASFALHAYAPAAGADPLGGDGVDAPGSLGGPVASDLAAAISPDGIELEATVSWGALGVPRASPLGFHPAVAAGTSLPGEVVDNGPSLPLRYFELALDADRVNLGPAPGTVDHAHCLTIRGNQPNTVNFWGVSSGGLRVSLHDDPDGDGIPDQLMADDQNGNGSFGDPGDVVDPAFDSDFDGFPDSGLLAPGDTYDLVARVTAATPLPPGSRDDLRLVAASSGLGTVFAEDHDVSMFGPLGVSPSTAKLAVAGGPAWHPHRVCNHSGAADSISLSLASGLGWTVSLVSDPDGDGDPSDGAPVASTGLLASGECFAVVAVIDAPPGSDYGEAESTRLSARLDAAPGSPVDVDDQTLVAPRLALGPPRAGVAAPGGAAFLPARLSSALAGPGAAVLDLAATSDLGSVVVIRTDPDGDGDPRDGAPLTESSLGANGGWTPLVIQVALPPDAPAGALERASVTATLRSDPSIQAVLPETVTVRAMDTFADPVHERRAASFARCLAVHARATGLDPAEKYRLEWTGPGPSLRRIFPNDAIGTSPDARGELSDSLVTVLTDPVGAWTVKVLRREQASWVDVGADATTTFTLIPEGSEQGAVTAAVFSDRLNYALTGDTVHITAVLQNPSSITYTDTFVDYVLHLDPNGNAAPDPGEIYITLAGTSDVWQPGRSTCRNTDVPDLHPGDRYLDTTCNVADVQFPASGVYHLHEAWWTACSGQIGNLEATHLNAGCLPAQIPPADAGPDRAICPGETVTVGTPEVPGLRYEWAPSAYLDAREVAQPQASPPMTVTYQLSVVDPVTHCVNTDFVTVSVGELPFADAGPDTFVCAATPAVTIGTPSLPGLRYSWAPGTGLSDPAAARPQASPAAPTDYTVTVTDAVTGCSTTDTVRVEPGTPAASPGGPGPLVAPVRLGVVPCDPAHEYHWLPATGLDSPSTCSPIASPVARTDFCLTVRDRRSGCESAPACVTVDPAPPPGCTAPQTPPAVARVLAVKAGVDRADVHLEWTVEPLARGGYRIYAVEDPADLAAANGPAGRRAFATTASELDAAGDDFGRVPGFPGEMLLYQVVGVCVDGVTEGAL